MDEQRAGRLQALAKHPSWPELVAAVEERQATYMAGITRRLIASGDLPDDFEFKRGFLAGMIHVTRYPASAEATLERAIAKSKEKEGDA